LSITGSGTLNVSSFDPPINAQLLSTNGYGVLLPTVVGAGLTFSGYTLSVTNASLPANASLLGSNSGGTAIAVTLGTGIFLEAGTLNVSVALPNSAQLIGSNSGGTATAVVVGSGLSLTSGTLSASTTAPANAALLGSNSGGTLQAVALGASLAITSGTLNITGVTGPASASFIYTNSGGTFLAGTVGAGLTLSGGTLTNNAFLVPASAALLASNAGSSLTAVSVGVGLAISGGTLSATGTAGVSSIVAAGLLTGGTITNTGTISFPLPAQGLFYSTGSAFQTLAIGANLSLAGGTLNAAGGSLQLTDGTHTVSGATSLTISGGTISGTSPNATLTISGGGGGSFAGGPVFGTTTTFSSPAPSNFSAGTIANSTIGTAQLTKATGCPLQVIVPLQGNANGLACQWQSSNGTSATVIALAECTPFFLANNPQAFAAAIVYVGTTGIYALGFSGTATAAELQLRLYTSNGLTLTATPISIPVASKTAWLKGELLTIGNTINFYYSPNNINNNWQGCGQVSATAFGSIVGVGVGGDGYQYYGTWGGGATPPPWIEVDLWEWSYTSP